MGVRGGGHAWWGGGGVHGRGCLLLGGVCMVKGGMCGEGGCVW